MAQFFQLNSGTVGVYRVQYPPEMLQSLIPAVQDKTMPPRDRLGLENDLFALVSQAAICLLIYNKTLDFEDILLEVSQNNGGLLAPKL